MVDIKNKKINKLPIIPLVLFLIVLFATIGLYIYNFSLTKNIEEKSQEIEKVNDSISDLKKDKRLQVYSLLESNKVILTKLEKRSKITEYIKHLEKIGVINSIKFSGFNLSNGKITTKASSNNKTDKLLAYMNVKNFIKKYRKDKNALFDLEFINSFEGMDTINFDVSFNIK